MAAEEAQAGEATKRQGSAQEGRGYHQRRERARLEGANVSPRRGQCIALKGPMYHLEGANVSP